jgi:tetratricopeptide (TPR) repeat protein
VWGVSCSGPKEQYPIEQNKEKAEAIFRNGSYLAQGSPESMLSIEKAIRTDTTFAEAWRELSVAYLKRGMPLEWKPLINEAVKHDAAIWQPMRGYLYLWFYRDYKKAIADFNASDTLTPHLDYPQGHSVDYWRGIAYLGLNDYPNSIAFWDKHIAKETADSGEDWVEIEAWLFRGIAHFESGALNKAQADFEKALNYGKNSADAHYYLAQIHSAQQQPEQAQAELELAKQDFKAGYFNFKDSYTETLRQIYWADLILLENQIQNP